MSEGSAITLLLGSTADGERVPLVGGNGRDVQVDVVARLVVEKLRSLNHKVSHLEEKGGPENLGASSGHITLVGLCQGGLPAAHKHPGMRLPF